MRLSKKLFEFPIFQEYKETFTTEHNVGNVANLIHELNEIPEIPAPERSLLFRIGNALYAIKYSLPAKEHSTVKDLLDFSWKKHTGWRNYGRNSHEAFEEILQELGVPTAGTNFFTHTNLPRTKKK